MSEVGLGSSISKLAGSMKIHASMRPRCSNCGIEKLLLLALVLSGNQNRQTYIDPFEKEHNFAS